MTQLPTPMKIDYGPQALTRAIAKVEEYLIAHGEFPLPPRKEIGDRLLHGQYQEIVNGTP